MFHVCYSFFEDFEYYLSDSSGLPITTDGKIVVHKRDGSCEQHTWTLKTWMNVSGIRYQSRTRLYCVQKPKRKDNYITTTLLLSVEPLQINSLPNFNIKRYSFQTL